MTRPCLVPQAFDAQALGRPFHRVLRLDPTDLARELALLPEPFMADAKLPAEDVQGAKALQRLGFAKVCVQVRLARPIDPNTASPRVREPLGRMEADPAELARHAANFRFNRMSLDPHVPPALALVHQRRWLENTYASPEILKFTAPDALVSFRADDHEARIDLVSVTGQRRGLGSRLMRELFAWCAWRGLSRVEVTTEGENLPAWRFYMKNGFTPVGAACVFHLHQGEWP